MRTLRSQIYQTFKGFLSRTLGPEDLRWGVGALLGLALTGSCLIHWLSGAKLYSATTVINPAFVSTNGVPFTPEQYATNGFSWRPIWGEQQLLCSQFLVGRALRTLGAEVALIAESGGIQELSSLVTSRLSCELQPNGIHLHGQDEDAARAAVLVNAIARTYRDQRDALAPAPPGCRKLSIEIGEPATTPKYRSDLPRLLRELWGACMITFAVMLFFPRGLGVETVPRHFLEWLLLVSGGLLLLTPMPVPFMLLASVLFALVISLVPVLVALVSEQSKILSHRFLIAAFATTFLVPVAIMVSGQLLSDRKGINTTAMVRLSLLAPGANAEDLATYTKEFLETERYRINYATMLKDDDFKHLASREFAGASSGQAVRYLQAATTVELVKGTSTLEISAPIAGIASKTAENYQRYWRERSKRDPEREVRVTTWNSILPPSARTWKLTQRNAGLVLTQLLNALQVLGGALALSMLASRPPLLWLLPITFCGYLLALGGANLFQKLSPEPYTACCVVRVWPAKSKPGENVSALLNREREIAASPALRAAIAAKLEKAEPAKQLTAVGWKAMTQEERLLWIGQHLKVLVLKNTFLLGFSASTDARQDAALLANAAAETYCAQVDQATRHGCPTPEVMDEAVRPLFPQSSSNPLAAGLTGILPAVLRILFGVAIGYIRYLTKHQAKVGIPLVNLAE